MAVATGGAGGSAKASQREIDWDQLDVKRFLVLGVASFSAVTTVLYPLTVVKTVQQAAIEPLSTAQTVAAVWRSGGVPAFYRGWSTVVIGTIPARVISLTSLEATKSAVTKWGRQLGTPDTALSGTANFAAGGVSSLVTQLITVPRDVVSQRQMVEDGRRPGCASNLQAEARVAAATAGVGAGAGVEAGTGAGVQGVKGGLAGMGGRAAEAWPVHRSSGAGQSLGAEATPKPVAGSSVNVSGAAQTAAAPSASGTSTSATISGAAGPAAQIQQQAGAGGSGNRGGGEKPLQASSSGRPAGEGDGGRSGGGKASRAASSLHGQHGQGSQRLAHIASKAVNVTTAGLHLNGSPPSQPQGQASLTAHSRNSAPSSISPSPAAAARAHSAAVGSGHSPANSATMSAGGSGFRAASSWSPSGGPEAPRPFPSTGTLQMVRCIVREEGVAGLYRGFGISVASTVPTSAVWWGSYGLFQQLLWDVLPTLRSSSPVSSNSISNSNAQSTPGVQHSAQQQLQPGVTEQPIQAAVSWLRRITASRTAPSEPTGVAAPDSPSPTPSTYASTSLAARSPTVLSSTPPSVSGGADVIAVQTLASLLAGVTSAAVTTPLDLVKTRVQVARKADGQANTFRAIASQILRDEGLRGMFRGSGPRIVSSAAWGCAMVTVYEWVKRTSHIADH